MANVGGMVAVKGRMPRVKPKFSRCCFCFEPLTPGTTIEALFDYDPTKKDAAEQLNIFYAHPVCLKHKMRVGDIREVPKKPGAEWVTDWHIRRFWELWGEFKGIGAAVRAMLPIIKKEG
ncbi:MAG: hypothetical protein K5841_10410 [Fretibacterium sp.]|nr:hypothetical protein [Fretibacterium sp.]